MKTGTILTGIFAFAGGLVTGLLLTPKSGRENRRWVSDHTRATKSWIEDKSNQIVEDSEKRIDQVSKGIKKTVHDNLPDLYEATETLNFSDEHYDEDI